MLLLDLATLVDRLTGGLIICKKMGTTSFAIGKVIYGVYIL